MKKKILIMITVFIGAVVLAHADETMYQRMAKAYENNLVRAEKGDLAALKMLCDDYGYVGRIPFEDKERALKLFEKYAHKGDVGSQHVTGMLYLEGEGAPKNNKTAVEWLVCAASQGCLASQLELGIIYSLGKGGIQENHKESLKWFMIAAEKHGNPWAQSVIGDANYRGDGIPINYKNALYWHEKAAEQGNHLSQFGMGEIYYNGKGVQVDLSKAYLWYKKAAEQGHERSQLMVGMMSLSGDGVEKNNLEAYKWLSLAATGKDKQLSALSKELLSQAEKEMSSDEISNGQKEATKLWETLHNR